MKEQSAQTKIKNKIWWRDFHGSPAFMDMQKALAKHGMHLKVEYIQDPVGGLDGKIATDVHVLKVTP